jgi:hypothetical protein
MKAARGSRGAMTKKAPKKASKSGRPKNPSTCAQISSPRESAYRFGWRMIFASERSSSVPAAVAFKTPAGVPRAKHHQFLIPGDDQIERWRQKLEDSRKLPLFDPTDTQQLLAEARVLSGGETTVDDAVAKLRAEKVKAQATELVKALGFDLDRPNVWEEAFGRLALIHYGVGRMVHRLPRQTCSIDESRLLLWVPMLQGAGWSEREAVRVLAANEGRFPYPTFGYRARPSPKGSKRSEQLSMGEEARLRKEEALWQQYQRAKRHHDPEVARRLVDAWGLGDSDSHFERELQLLDFLERPPPLPEEETTPPGGDKYQWENEMMASLARFAPSVRRCSWVP